MLRYILHEHAYSMFYIKHKRLVTKNKLLSTKHSITQRRKDKVTRTWLANLDRNDRESNMSQRS